MCQVTDDLLGGGEAGRLCGIALLHAARTPPYEVAHTHECWQACHDEEVDY